MLEANNFYVYEYIRTDSMEPFYVGKGSGNRYLDLVSVWVISSNYNGGREQRRSDYFQEHNCMMGRRCSAWEVKKREK